MINQARTHLTRLCIVAVTISTTFFAVAPAALSSEAQWTHIQPGTRVGPGRNTYATHQVIDTSADTASSRSAALLSSGVAGGASAIHALRPDLHARALQEERSEDIFALVATPQELLRAVEQGTPHIRITAHIDLTLTAVSPLDFQIRILSSIKSITGSCAEPPVLGDFSLDPEQPLLPLARGQCLLVTRSGFLKSASGPLWLDNLYLRRERAGPAVVANVGTEGAPPLVPLVVTDNPEGLLWATGVVFQCDGGSGAAAAEILSAAFFDGCTFTGFRGGSVPVLVSGVGSSASFQSCTFTGNSGLPGRESPFDVEGLVRLYGSGGSFVRLEDCTFEDNTVDYVAVDASDVVSGKIFADSPEVEMWRAATQEVLFALPLQQAEAIGFVDDEWRWFPLTVEEAGGSHYGAAATGCIAFVAGLVAMVVA